jgi:hypothetical protein
VKCGRNSSSDGIPVFLERMLLHYVVYIWLSQINPACMFRIMCRVTRLNINTTSSPNPGGGTGSSIMMCVVHRRWRHTAEKWDFEAACSRVARKAKTKLLVLHVV